MTIQSKFDVGDIVQYKYASKDLLKSAVVFEVIEVNAQKCYGGTQVFLMCRGIHTHYEGYGENKKFKTFMAGATANGEYSKFREDEMSPCSKEIGELLNSEQSDAVCDAYEAE